MGREWGHKNDRLLSIKIYHSKISWITAVWFEVSVKEISADQDRTLSITSHLCQFSFLATEEISVSRAALESHPHLVVIHHSTQKS